MPNYTIDADWSGKDNLTSGSALKVVRGSEFQIEFEAIATAISSKYEDGSTVDIDGGTIDNTAIGATTASTGNFSTLSIAGTAITSTAAELNILDGKAFLDDDDMASDSATGIPSQQSVKAYVDSQVSASSIAGITSTADATAITIDSSETVKINGLTVGAGGSSFSSTNAALGENALSSLTSGTKNIAIGTNSLASITTNNDNIAVGWYAMNSASNTSALKNVAIGSSALSTHTYPRWTVAVGHSALRLANSFAWANTAIGNDSLENVSTGSNNTGCGAYAGNLTTTGSNNTSIGYNSDPSSATASNEVTLGDTSITALRCNVTSITSLSDIRDKTNIADLSNCAAFVKELEPVSFDWNRRDESMQGVHAHGFIAQQLKAAQESTGHQIPGLVFEENPEKLEAAYGNLLPTVVAALKEALVEIDELKAKVAALENA